MSIIAFFGAAAADLAVGESTTVSNDQGDSYTVRRETPTQNSVVGNNEQSKAKLAAATQEEAP